MIFLLLGGALEIAIQEQLSLFSHQHFPLVQIARYHRMLVTVQVSCARKRLPEAGL